MEKEKLERKTIKSFVKRVGRITNSQQNALDNLFDIYSLPLDAVIDLEQVFNRDAPTVLEIGFGNGSSLAQMAKESPEKNFIGIEVHRPGIGMLLSLVEQFQLSNVRVIEGDAVEILQNNLPDNSLAGLQLFFPDPWPKKRHHKRRIVQPQWLELVAQKLIDNGFVHMATDWGNYAEHMMETLEECPLFENTADKNQYIPRPESRPKTKFEQRGEKLGHGVWDLMFRKV